MGSGSVAAWVRLLASSFGRTCVCGPIGEVPPGGRDRLIDLGAAATRHEHAVRVVREDQSHRGIVGRRTAQRPAQARSFAARSGSAVRTQASTCSASRPRSNRHRAAVLRAQGLLVGPKLGQRRALTHRGVAIGKAERDALAPGLRRDRLECDEPHVRPRVKANPAARRDGRDRSLSTRNLDLLVRIAREFRDRSERAEAPLRVGILDLAGNENREAPALPTYAASIPRGRYRGWRFGMIVKSGLIGYRRGKGRPHFRATVTTLTNRGLLDGNATDTTPGSTA